ncbi:CBS domain-containing protein [Streptomyces sp. ISL-43]|uniref:CBS domain-containing protein n=1 Tax=Streptomyces sp. ISL-43 TaxID=2819183 RepID=UPI001BEB2844|nr:CBS domain-containing protein [Streptomyces sp. ISL-43]MBT2452727.1 CBS domain-containing protein [Streptomyces sp. ISL-43]
MKQRPSTEELLARKGTEMPIGDFLELFGVRVRRPWNVHDIAQALTDAGLATLPDFANCAPGDRVQIVALATTTPLTPGPDEGDAAGGDSLPSAALPQRLRIGDLPSARGGVRCVAATTALSQATYLMRHRGYAQIPVTTGMTTLHGVLTWRSLALMYERGKEPSLENAMEQDSLPVADVRQEFFACLSMLTENGYLLVRGEDGSLSGIVTQAHVVDRFESAARPFFLLGEIESLLRRWLGAKLAEDAIKAVQTNRKPEHRSGKVEDLMFGDYVYLINGEQKKQAIAQQADLNWGELQCDSLDRGQFIRHLQRVQEIRNRIAHFDAEPLPHESMRELTAFTALLRDYVG